MTQIIDTIYTANMTPEQRNWFYAEYEQARKDGTVGVLLAIFLGGLGIHHFYLRRDGLGIIYLLLSWTGIPMLIGFIEAFFMPDRVRRYNTAQAAFISSQIHATHLVPAVHCPSCEAIVEPAATFCTRCGAAVHPAPSAIQATS